jgi:choice-of-anchor B domain-containing protein
VALLVAPRVLAAAPIECENGMAGSFACHGVDLLFSLSFSELGGASSGNDVWGWVDPATSREYAIYGLNDGVAFVDVTAATSPVLVGTLPTHSADSLWRDMRTYADHLYVVSEASNHGMQVFGLAALGAVSAAPTTFTESAHYSEFSTAHHLTVNDETGYAYVLGSNTCSGGLHMVDLSNPVAPVPAGCFSADGYTHDAQCVLYSGPDVEHAGKEICFAANVDTLTIVDVSNKASPLQIARRTYSGSGYANSVALSDDHSRLFLADETDEADSMHNTRTRVWGLDDLETATVIDSFDGPLQARDTEVSFAAGTVYVAAWTGGLRLLRQVGTGGALVEVGYFDTYPASDDTGFHGAWGVYPFLPGGAVLVGTEGDGLFGVRVVIDVFADGFESGGLSSWSLAVP